jgi:hypothetical protein
VNRGILIISSCTATKALPAEGGADRAESLYAGQQHVRLMRGVREYRDAAHPAGQLHFHILSAFHGLLPAHKSIASYDQSFSGLPVEAIRRLGRAMNVPRDIRKLLSRPVDLAILILGDPYLRACALDTDVELASPTIAFCSPKVARWLPNLEGLRLVELSNREAHRFSCGLAALKGELAGRTLIALSQTPEEVGKLQSPDLDLLDWLKRMPSTSAVTRPLLAAS